MCVITSQAQTWTYVSHVYGDDGVWPCEYRRFSADIAGIASHEVRRSGQWDSILETLLPQVPGNNPYVLEYPYPGEYDLILGSGTLLSTYLHGASPTYGHSTAGHLGVGGLHVASRGRPLFPALLEEMTTRKTGNRMAVGRADQSIMD